MKLYSQILQYFFSGVTVGSIYAIIALCFTIVYNSTEAINFAQGEFVMLGGMVAVALYSVKVPLLLAFLLAVSFTTLVGISLERLAIRPAREASVITIIIITIGASVFLRGLAMLAWGKDPFPLPPFSSEIPIRILGATLLPQTLWILGIAALLMLLLRFFFEHTVTGKAMRACAINRHAAGLLGISTKKMVFLSFILSSSLGAISGIIIAPITMTAYDVGTMLGLKGFCGAIVGGLGHSFGAIIGGFLLGILEALAAGLVSSRYKDALAFLLMLLVLFLKPRGILGWAEKGKKG